MENKDLLNRVMEMDDDARREIERGAFMITYMHHGESTYRRIDIRNAIGLTGRQINQLIRRGLLPKPIKPFGQILFDKDEEDAVLPEHLKMLRKAGKR